MIQSNLNKYRIGLKENKLIPEDYFELKDFLQSQGKHYALKDVKKKKQKTMLLKLWDDFKLEQEHKPLFLSNLYLYDEEEFIFQIEDAIGSKCKVEDIAKYIDIHYQIKENMVLFKLLEFEIYHTYERSSRKQERIEQILKVVRPLIEPKEIKKDPVCFDSQLVKTGIVDLQVDLDQKYKEYIKVA